MAHNRVKRGLPVFKQLQSSYDEGDLLGFVRSKMERPSEQGSTLDPATNQPTNQPTTYASLRVTIPHTEIGPVLEKFQDCEWYIAYPHVGKFKSNEHFHIFLPAVDRKDVERYRRRMKIMGLTGNAKFSIKFMENVLKHGIQYASKEGTMPLMKGALVEEWITDAPEWEETTKKRKFDPKQDENGIKLTANNLLRRAFFYRKDKGAKTGVRQPKDIAMVISEMTEDGYYIDAALARQGVPDFYKDLFSDSCDTGKLSWGVTYVNTLFKPFKPYI